ncbi:hypothetical protein B0T17DRAFT_657566 [Bombardia bombarda]|uniref:Glucose-methanol-choline oxidoreductase C-terminal domain-containing protein n=1 Tax=Bombardia bombarda TaxID=252184 RepID=A0AA39W4X2_9PEZI|nr:hypothetical protein B0T17DRAFT_657566 [Bombardia bombarda]
MDAVLQVSIQNVIRRCQADYYDYIVVGSGFGGGVLTQTLCTAPVKPPARVLLIERGGFEFSSHCLNTPRPHWATTLTEGPSQDNDIVFRAVKSSVNTVSSSSYEYTGGPVHCIGGRSIVWGLYTPTMHPDEASAHFPASVCSYLSEKDGYNKAYRLLCNDKKANLASPYPLTVFTIESVIQNVNKALDEGIGRQFNARPFEVCAMGAQFASHEAEDVLYRPLAGAFSTVSWIMGRVHNHDEQLTVLANTQVVTVNQDDHATDAASGKKIVTSLTVRQTSSTTCGCCSCGEKEWTIPVGKKTRVVLSAGTIDTAVIALRSGIGSSLSHEPDQTEMNVGRGLMDHDIWGTRFEIATEGGDLGELGAKPLKLQSWVRFGNESNKSDWVLLNIAINAPLFFTGESTFARAVTYMDGNLDLLTEPQFEDKLRGGSNRNGEDVKRGKMTIQVVYEFCANLNNSNRVLDTPQLTPTLLIERLDDNSPKVPEMCKLASCIGDILAKAISKPYYIPADKHIPSVPPTKLARAGFGAVAHEVGTMRMAKTPGEKGAVVDENLGVIGWSNLYVCDLSVFPVSPAANPTLTLTALAQRLGHHLLEVRP